MSNIKKPETEPSVKAKNEESEKKKLEINPQETPEERRIRREKMRRRKELIRKRRQKALMLRAALALGGLLIVVLIVLGISSLLKKDTKKDGQKIQETVESTEPEVVLSPVGFDEVLHLSFDSLIADTQIAFSQEDASKSMAIDQGHLMITEFEQILQQLYQQGYVLVRLQDLVEEQENGTLKAKELMLAQGKKPLIISQQNVSYSLDTYGQGLATKLALDEAGNIVNEMIASDGTTVTGAYDIVTCVNAFVQNHPDFSHEGAKGILGISGAEGVLGYRTDASFAVSEGNTYASEYGVFDTAQETESVKAVVNALKESGWEFACSGYQYISYHQDQETVSQDLELWKTNLGDIFGEIKIFLYPNGIDCETGQYYSSDNEIYTLLKEQGFTYFSSLDLAGITSGVTGEYVKCNYLNVDGYRMYQEVYENAGRFQGILDFSAVYDTNRPSLHTDEAIEEGQDTATEN